MTSLSYPAPTRSRVVFVPDAPQPHLPAATDTHPTPSRTTTTGARRQHPQTSASVAATVVTGAETVSSESSQGSSCPANHEPDIHDKYFFQLPMSDNFEYHKTFFEYQEHEFESRSREAEHVSVKGRLKKQIDYWKNIGASDFVVSVIEKGYVIPFIETPKPSFKRNNRSAENNLDFVLEAVKELVDSGRVVKTPFKPIVVNPLSVSENKSGKKRLILDLRITNKCIWKEKIVFEDQRVALDYFTKGGFCFKFDIEKAYHHFDICSKHQTFLGFSVDGEYYCFTVLPFGLTSSPYLFTKCLRDLVKFWRSNAIQIVLFLDDGWGTNRNKDLCAHDSYFVKDSLSKAGFSISDKKCLWEPVQQLEWIGYMWNAEEFSISIPERRITDLMSSLQSIIDNLPFTTARKLAQCVGKIISMQAVVGNIAKLMSKYIYMYIETRVSWDSVLRLEANDPCIEELVFWNDNVKSLNLKRLLDYAVPEVIIYSDASSVATGAYMVKVADSIFHRNWSVTECSKSSTYRELKGVTLALDAYKDRLQNRSVQWFSDSQSCVKIVSSGSMKSELQFEAIQIYNICIQNNIRLNVAWVPRGDNTIADEISKYFDRDDWGVSKEFFNFMDSVWGPFTVDRFANDQNTKLSRFNSKYWCVNTSGVDAFAQNWESENNWLVPPIHLVCKVIIHLIECKAQGTLIVPHWPSASFWPFLFDYNFKCKKIVEDILEFSPKQNIFVHGCNKKSLFGSNKFGSKVLAVKLRG